MPKQAAAEKREARTVRPLRPIEERMLEKGYVSSRMAAQKLNMSHVTVLRMCQSKENPKQPFECLRPGQQVWILIASVVKHYKGTDMAKMTDLKDWSFPDGLTGD